MVSTEVSFPRGGVKPKIGFKEKKKFDFLGNSDKIGKKKRYTPKVIKTDDVVDDDVLDYPSDVSSEPEDKIKAISAEKISNKTIQTGMVILGRIVDLNDTRISVSLPGRLIGFVMASQISVPYTKLLQSYISDQIEDIKKIDSMFTKGEYVNVKVVSVENNGNTTLIGLSMIPQDVNSGIVYNNLHEGSILRGAVESIEDHGYVIDLGISNCRSFLPLKFAEDDQRLDVGQVIWCAIKKCQKTSNSSIVTISNKSNALKSAKIKIGQTHNVTIHDLKAGMGLDFHVTKPLRDGAEGIILSDLVGYVHVSQICEKIQVGNNVKAYLLYVMPISKLPFFTTREIFESLHPNMEEEAPFKAGKIINDAKVSKVAGNSIIFKFDNAIGIIPKMHSKASEMAEENLKQMYKGGSTHTIRVLKYHPSDYAYICSDKTDILEKKYFSLEDLKIGKLVEAEVMKLQDKGILVKIDEIRGWIPDLHCSDVGICTSTTPTSKHTNMISKKYKVGQVIAVRVLRIDVTKNLLHLTAKTSLLESKLKILSRYNKAKIGSQYKGTIVHFMQSGIIVTFFGEVRAFVPISEMSSEKISNIKSTFNLGQVVNCTVLSVDPEKEKMTCSFLTPEARNEKTLHTFDVDRENVEENSNKVSSKDQKRSREDNNDKKKKKQKTSISDISDVNIDEAPNNIRKKRKTDIEKDEVNESNTTNVCNEDNTNNVETSKTKKKKKKAIKHETVIDKNKPTSEEIIKEKCHEIRKKAKLIENPTSVSKISSMKNFWDLDSKTISNNISNTNNDISSSESDSEVTEKVKKKKKKLTTAEKMEKVREEEAKLRIIEQKLMEQNSNPQSSDQFDRLLMADPNNSELWIAYMAFHLQSTEIERARAIAKKALNTISFREEQEKLNIWLALLNLENRFGTKESLSLTLEQAVQMNDSYKINSKMLDMYVEMGKTSELTNLVDILMAKYRHCPDAYVAAGQACYNMNLVEKGRAVMQKAIHRIESKKHIPIIIKFAHMESNHGDSERAETLFEQIIGCMPQRVDVWCVYVDMMMKTGKLDNSRLILERAVAQKLPPKKMKILYKKWLEIEEKYGSVEDIENVRQMAKQYVEQSKE